jgi:DNA-binding NtrC family response regulator
MKYQVLYVDDDRANLDTFRRAFRFDYEVMTAESGAEGLEILKGNPEIALIVADQRMPGMKGTEFLEKAMGVNPHAQRMVLTAFTDLDALLDAIQKGHVYDYVVKPWEPAALKGTMDKALAIYDDRIERIKQLVAAQSENAILKEEVNREYDFDHIIGADGALADVIATVRKVAPTDSTVLIRGETGTGKELVAHAVHAASARSGKALVKLNCAALSPGVLESEFFGHEKGAFTGAVAAKKGRFEVAHGGTLFLDEIGDLPEAVQVKLLRVIQEGEFERVGGNETKKVDVRLVTATHQPLERLVEEGRFRQDLFYRLNVIPVSVPPLRERRADIPLIVDHFLGRYCANAGKSLSMNDEARRLLMEYDWPGNVRELKNVIERAVILGEGVLGPDDFSIDIQAINRASSNLGSIDSTEETLSVLSKVHDENARALADAIRKANGNISETARILGVPRSTLVYRLKKYKVI